jgi:hypothetical protein
LDGFDSFEFPRLATRLDYIRIEAGCQRKVDIEMIVLTMVLSGGSSEPARAGTITFSGEFVALPSLGRSSCRNCRVLIYWLSHGIRENLRRI